MLEEEMSLNTSHAITEDHNIVYKDQENSSEWSDDTLRLLGYRKRTCPSPETINNLPKKIRQVRTEPRRYNTSTVTILTTWLKNNIKHPYPTDSEKRELMGQTGLNRAQIRQWFVNARRRYAKEGKGPITTVSSLLAITAQPKVNNKAPMSACKTVKLPSTRLVSKLPSTHPISKLPSTHPISKLPSTHPISKDNYNKIHDDHCRSLIKNIKLSKERPLLGGEPCKMCLALKQHITNLVHENNILKQALLSALAIQNQVSEVDEEIKVVCRELQGSLINDGGEHLNQLERNTEYNDAVQNIKLETPNSGR